MKARVHKKAYKSEEQNAQEVTIIWPSPFHNIFTTLPRPNLNPSLHMYECGLIRQTSSGLISENTVVSEIITRDKLKETIFNGT
jgi:hypothetical protein